jgi:recombination protein RecR
MLLAYGFLRKVFQVFERYKTSIDMITTSEVAVSITIDDTRNLDSILNDLKDFCSVEVSGDQSIICVVVDTRDVLAIESTNQYKGLYHVLGGIISPLEGIGPSDLQIDSLLKRIEHPEDEAEPVKEIILALSPTMEGDTTAFYLQKKLKFSEIKVSTIARGIPIGGDLEYADEITLGRSIVSRVAYD